MKILVINTILILLILSDPLNFRMSDKRILRSFNSMDVPVDIEYFRIGDQKIRYLAAGDKKNPMILFIHGAPGSLDAFMNFLKDADLNESFYLISVDRPGYGYSDLGNPVHEIKNQAELISSILDKNRHSKKPVLVGHSYGGTIAARIAMDYPEKTGGIILVGAATDANHERVFWISYLFKLPWLKWLLPAAWEVANIEKLTHKEELKRLIPDWKLIKCPVTILHGENDSLVPVENAYFTDKMVESEHKRKVIKEKTGHLIPFIRPEFIKEEILIMNDLI